MARLAPQSSPSQARIADPLARQSLTDEGGPKVKVSGLEELPVPAGKARWQSNGQRRRDGEILDEAAAEGAVAVEAAEASIDRPAAAEAEVLLAQATTSAPQDASAASTTGTQGSAGAAAGTTAAGASGSLMGVLLATLGLAAAGGGGGGSTAAAPTL